MIVDDAICLGGAFAPPPAKQLASVLDNCLGGTLVNAYSRNDQVLQTAFRAANLDAADAAGTVPMAYGVQLEANTSSSGSSSSSRQKILNLDVTEQIPVDEGTQFGHCYSRDVLNTIAEYLKDVL